MIQFLQVVNLKSQMQIVVVGESFDHVRYIIIITASIIYPLSRTNVQAICVCENR